MVSETVQLNIHNCIAAFFLPGKTEAADICPGFRHYFGDSGNGAGCVTVKDNERRVLAGNEDIHAVYLGDENIAAADAAALKAGLMAGGIGKGDARSIRMSPLDLAGGNSYLESGIGSQFRGKTNPSEGSMSRIPANSALSVP